MSLAAIHADLEDKMTAIRCAGSAIRLALEPLGASPEENSRCEEALFSTAALLDYICQDIENLLHSLNELTKEERR